MADGLDNHEHPGGAAPSLGAADKTARAVRAAVDVGKVAKAAAVGASAGGAAGAVGNAAKESAKILVSTPESRNRITRVLVGVVVAVVLVVTVVLVGAMNLMNTSASTQAAGIRKNAGQAAISAGVADNQASYIASQADTLGIAWEIPVSAFRMQADASGGIGPWHIEESDAAKVPAPQEYCSQNDVESAPASPAASANPPATPSPSPSASQTGAPARSAAPSSTPLTWVSPTPSPTPASSSKPTPDPSLAAYPGAEDFCASTVWVLSQMNAAFAAEPSVDRRFGLGDGARVGEDRQVRWEDEKLFESRLIDPYAKALATLPLQGADETWSEDAINQAVYWHLGLTSPLCVAGGPPQAAALTTDTDTGSAPSSSPAASQSPTASASPMQRPSPAASAGAVDLSGVRLRQITSSDGQVIELTPAMLTNLAVMMKTVQDHQDRFANPELAMVIGTITMAVESNFLNLASRAVPESQALPNDGVVAGDHDSVGIFQQRAYSGAWGSPARIMDTSYSSAMFFGLEPAGAPSGHARGLLQIPGWEMMAPGVAAQKVQVSAFPDRYGTWVDSAKQLVTQLAGVDLSALGTGVIPAPCSNPAGGPGTVLPGEVSAGDTYLAFWQSRGGAPGADTGVDPWAFYWGECVSYTAWMVRTTTGHTEFVNYYTLNGRTARFGNAKEWPAAAKAVGIPVDATPAVGSIAVRMSGTWGHVAYVTKVHPNGNIDVSEYNYASHHVYGVRTDVDWRASGAFDEFIHFETTPAT